MGDTYLLAGDLCGGETFLLAGDTFLLAGDMVLLAGDLCAGDKFFCIGEVFFDDGDLCVGDPLLFGDFDLDDDLSSIIIIPRILLVFLSGFENRCCGDMFVSCACFESFRSLDFLFVSCLLSYCPPFPLTRLLTLTLPF